MVAVRAFNGLSRSGPLAGTAVLVVTTLTLAGCGAGAATKTDTNPPGTRTLFNGDLANYHGTLDVSDKTKIVMKIGDYYYEPSILVGRPGQKLAVQFYNVADHRHNFAIEEGAEGQILDENVEPETQANGQTATVIFPKSGHVLFESEFFEHRGMRGQLEVK